MPEFLYFNLKNITATTKHPVQLALSNYIIKETNKQKLLVSSQMFIASATVSLWEGKDECCHPRISPTSSTSCDLQKPPYVLDFFSALVPQCPKRRRLRLRQNKADRCRESLIHTTTYPVVYRTTSTLYLAKTLRQLRICTFWLTSPNSLKKWETKSWGGG